ncbi:MAG TPA: DUF992 domain-containing protein [Caulobacteraceae bacterium]|nr:DUF992 domain-containing protein [Caulobacteraceae bacterium]
MRNWHRAVAGALAVSAVALATAAPAQGSGVRVGVLNCRESSGWGFIVGSTRDLRCVFVHDGRVVAHYRGSIDKFGVDVGYHSGGILTWAVIAPTNGPPPGSLNGHYGGLTAGATVGVGLSANALVGGLDRSIALQPLSVEGEEGLNVAAGVGAMTLQYLPD